MFNENSLKFQKDRNGIPVLPKFSSRMCLNKRSFVYEQEAYVALSLTKAVDDLHVYRCNLCSRFHLGHSRRKYGKFTREEMNNYVDYDCDE